MHPLEVECPKCKAWKHKPCEDARSTRHGNFPGHRFALKWFHKERKEKANEVHSLRAREAVHDGSADD